MINMQPIILVLMLKIARDGQSLDNLEKFLTKTVYTLHLRFSLQ